MHVNRDYAELTFIYHGRSRLPRECLASRRKPVYRGDALYLRLLFRNLTDRKLIWPIVFVTIAYCVTRASSLGRDLVPEEPCFLGPGRFLLLGSGFSFDWGILSPHENAFTKPPLTSLLLGIFSFVGHNQVMGARLVPFLIGLWTCLLPLIATGSWVPSALLLMSPFFYGAASHMQTDPTVGLLGYGLVCWGATRFVANESSSPRGLILIASGLLVLWLGKLETAILATSFLSIVFLLHERRWLLARWLVPVTIAWVCLFVVVTWELGRTANVPYSESVQNVYQTMTRITGSLSQMRNRPNLFRVLEAFKLPELFALCLVPSLAIMAAKGRAIRWRRSPQIYLLAASLIPGLAYLYGGFAGDGFPRYFLNVFPPLFILLGLCLGELGSRARAWVAAAILVIGAAVMLPQTVRACSFSGSVNAAPGTTGTLDAANYLLAVTHPNDLVVAPDAAGYYLIGKRARLILQSFEEYPTRYDQVRLRSGEVRGMIISFGQRNGIVGELVAAMEQRGAKSARIGSWEVFYIP